MSGSIFSKSFFLRSGIFALLFSLAVLSMACEIDIKVSDKFKKDSYKVGDELVVEVYVILNHRNCHIDISETKFKASGAKIVGATKWEKRQSNTYFRKLKVKVTEGNKPDIKILCQRICDKEGGVAKLTLTKE